MVDPTKDNSEQNTIIQEKIMEKCKDILKIMEEKMRVSGGDKQKFTDKDLLDFFSNEMVTLKYKLFKDCKNLRMIF